MTKFKVIHGNAVGVERQLNEIEGSVEIISTESKFDKYGVDKMVLVVKYIPPVAKNGTYIPEVS